MTNRRCGVLLSITLLGLLILPRLAAAEQITIYRDSWGVPHVYAETELGAAYGYGYAQAQDRLEQICRNYRDATGTMAEAFGPDYVAQDYQRRIVQHAKMSETHYGELPAEVRAYCEAYQAGIKRYMQEHPEQVPDWAPELHPWQITAVLRAIIFNWPLGEAMGDLKRAIGKFPDLSSNEWSIGPKRSAEGCAMLFIDPHIPWDGMFRFHEARLSGGQLHVSGFCPVGTPFVGLGHNDHIGWACTTGGPDTSDIFAEKLNPGNPTQYLVDGQWRDATVETVQIKVKEDGSTRTETRQIVSTRHGPVVYKDGNTAYALATPYLDQTGLTEMIYRLDRAKSTDEVRAVSASNQWMAQNFMFAGTDGNIGYVRVGRVPIRAQGTDPSMPIPGDKTANDWLGIHPQSDLVQITDPVDGYMQNCNSAPTIMCKTRPVDPSRYPSYIYNAATDRPWHSRGTRAVELLDADRSVTLEEALAIVNDTHVLGWEKAQPILKAAAERLRSQIQALDAQDIVDTLLRWDGNMETDSVGATLFFAWWNALPAAAAGIDRGSLLRGRQVTPEEGDRLLTALRPAVEALIEKRGTWEVPWGQINRVGRGERDFPLAGCATGDVVTLRAVGGDIDTTTGKIRCAHGQSCTTLVLFKPGAVESYSVTPWGESDDAKSPHFLDQAEKLFSQKKLKPTWFQKKALLSGDHVESTLNLEWSAP